MDYKLYTGITILQQKKKKERFSEVVSSFTIPKSMVSLLTSWINNSFYFWLKLNSNSNSIHSTKHSSSQHRLVAFVPNVRPYKPLYIDYLDVWSNPCIFSQIIGWIPLMLSSSDEVFLLVVSDGVVVDLFWVYSWCRLACGSVNTLTVAQVSVQQESTESEGHQDQGNYH